MRTLLTLEALQLVYSPSRLAAFTLVPLAPLLLRLLGLVGPGLVFPLFVIAYQLLGMCLVPWGVLGVRAGWRLAWLAGPPGPVHMAVAVYLGILAAYSAAPVAAYLAAASLVLGSLPSPPILPYLVSIGVLHQAVGILALSLPGGPQRGWAILLSYQSLLIVLAAAIISERWAAPPFYLYVLFPSLAALGPPLPEPEAYAAPFAIVALSLLLLSLFSLRLVRPGKTLQWAPVY